MSEKSIKKMMDDIKREEKERISNLPDWAKELQEYGQNCTFEIFSIHYPWSHKDCQLISKYFGDNICTIMNDGFPIVRFRVLNDGKKFRLLQYRFWNSRENKFTCSNGALILRALQDRVWKQSWNEDLTINQVKEFLRLQGLVSYSNEKAASVAIKKHGKIPRELTNTHSLDVQMETGTYSGKFISKKS
ncbi:MAG: hypothetical protein WC119_00595 [Synergistaceae bacterium]